MAGANASSPSMNATRGGLSPRDRTKSIRARTIVSIPRTIVMSASVRVPTVQ
jgi:hypothetical protein